MTVARRIPRAVIAMLFAVTLTSHVWAGEKKLVEVIQATEEIPEESLLDVGIRVFDPGLPVDPFELYELESKGIFEDVRKSEARYFAMTLKHTLQSSGFWGAVRIVPEANNVDLVVSGAILESTGKRLKLEIQVIDARGKEWFRRDYKDEANPMAYARKDTAVVGEPFQSLYNEIANDILEKYRKLDEEDLREVRAVAELRFASDVAPTAFESYLKSDDKGRHEIEKLPSRGDPMMERIANIRIRDYMFVDTLNEYYSDFSDKMDTPYNDWRAYSYEEQMALDELRSKAKWEKIAGIAAIVGGAMAQGKGRWGGAVGDAAMIGGMVAIADGMSKSEEAKMHVEALRELASSFDADVAPMLIDVEGEVMRLSGSAEAQYAQWRTLLRQIFATETGLPVDPNAEATEPKEQQFQ